MRIGEVWINKHNDEKATIIGIESNGETNLSKLDEALHNFIHRNLFNEPVNKNDDWVRYKKEDDTERVVPRKTFVKNWERLTKGEKDEFMDE